ncbi:MAG: D-alanine--D-alanine ligase [Promethearchaeota archaeon]|nr:MAG: D-alanine--D-alanine ligase [Candidatus Lokiarchaeota archaeon]
MSDKSVFIYEFVSGGGFNKINIPISLFCEGFAMLRATIASFKELSFKITTLLDDRITYLSCYLKTDQIDFVAACDEYYDLFENHVKKCDYCFIIAPEFSEILYNLTKIVEKNEKTLLSINLPGIKLATHKFKTFQYFKQYGVKTPQTYLLPRIYNFFDKDFAIRQFKRLKGPIVIKQEDGVGADGIFLLTSEKQIHHFFEDFSHKLDPEKSYILQEYIEGEDLSVSLIGTSNSPIILSINSQSINISAQNTSSEYIGGNTPVKNFETVKKEIIKVLNCLNLELFQGYFGIDFIRKSNGENYLIEINPRLTTSYIGICNILHSNPAELIVQAKLEPLKLLNEPSLKKKHSKFLRLELEYIGEKPIEELQEKTIPDLIKLIPEILTPPITVQSLSEEHSSLIKSKYSCFIATEESSFFESEKRIKKIKRFFKENHFKILS